MGSDVLPEWTKSSAPAITTPLTLPDNNASNATAKSTSEQECPCLMCSSTFDVPSKKDDFLRHLLEDHFIVIDNVSQVADLPGYVNYWKQKLETGSVLTEFCSVTKSKVKKDDEVEEKEKEFYMLSDVLMEDKELRVQLQMKRLEEVLEIQAAERNDKTFKRSCLFCRTEFEESYVKLLDHMAHDHHFSVGLPHNLVFVNELLDTLEKKLDDKVCIFCEKVFKTREVLKEHMRKKMHKKINPKNKAYDKFYLINYREFGKNWESLGSKNRRNSSNGHFLDEEEDELPNGFESDGSEDDSEERDWSDWRGGDKSSAVCLFCPANYSERDDLLMHMTCVHDFDFQDVRNSLKLDFYLQVKVINFVRRRMHLNQCIFCGRKEAERDKLVEHMAEEEHMRLPEDREEWNQAEYFFPTYENDMLLNLLDDDVYETNDGVPVESEDIEDKLKGVEERTAVIQQEFKDLFTSGRSKKKK